MGILYNPSEEKAVPGRREIDSEYGEDVSRLPLFTNRPDPGCVRNVKTIQRISSSSWGRRGTGSPDGRERSGISETGLRGAAGSADGDFSQVEADEEGNLIRVEGILRPYSQKIVRKRLRKRYVLAEVGLFGRQEPFYLGSVCQEIGSGKGEDKYGRNTFDDSKDCRGETAVRMGRESRAEAVEWRSILFCRRKNVVCDSDYDRQRRNDARNDYPEFAK